VEILKCATCPRASYLKKVTCPVFLYLKFGLFVFQNENVKVKVNYGIVLHIGLSFAI
jgi:hypothetical protein